MTDTVLSRFFLQTNGSKGCSKNKKSTQRSQQQQKEITLNDGWRWWMLVDAGGCCGKPNKTARKTIQQSPSEKTKKLRKQNQQQQYQKLRKRCKSSQRESSRTLSLSLTHTHSLSLRIFGEKNRRRIERPRACSSNT